MLSFRSSLRNVVPFLSIVSANDTQRSVARQNGTTILFPLYIYPDPGNWDPLFTAIESNPSTNFDIIVNPNSGPGNETYPDDEYKAGISKLNSYPRVRCLGYVHALYANRSVDLLLAEVTKYAGWSKYSGSDIHVNGIFIDEAPSAGTSGNVDYIKKINSLVKTSFTTGQTQGWLVINPGVICDKILYNASDLVVSFEAAYSSLTVRDTLFTSTDATKSAGTSMKQNGVLIHSFDGKSRQQTDLVNKIVNQSVGALYITTCNPSAGQGDYNAFSALWSGFVSATEAANIGNMS